MVNVHEIRAAILILKYGKYGIDVNAVDAGMETKLPLLINYSLNFVLWRSILYGWIRLLRLSYKILENIV